jgi:hypothetical protein
MVDTPGLGDLSGGLGGLIGNLFGQSNVNDAIQGGVNAVNQDTWAGAMSVAPFTAAGANYIQPTINTLLNPGTGSSNIGMGRISSDVNPVDFETFAKNYNASEGAQYLMRTAAEAQNSSAAAKGGLLSGANLRAQTGIAEGIANQDLLDQYKAFTTGQQQDFQQRETSYQNLYGQEAMGLQAGTAQAGVFAQGARALGSLSSTQAQAAAQQSSGFGSALGTIFKGIGMLVPGGQVVAGA